MSNNRKRSTIIYRLDMKEWMGRGEQICVDAVGYYLFLDLIGSGEERIVRVLAGMMEEITGGGMIIFLG